MKKSVFRILVCVLILSLALPAASNHVLAEGNEPPAPTPTISQWESNQAQPERFEPEQFPPQESVSPPELAELFPGEGQITKPREFIPPSPEAIALTQQQVQSFVCADVTDVPVTECQALVALYNSTTGAGWANSTNWLTGTLVANWYGVYVQNGQVTALDLSGNQLTGSIPPELGSLTSMWYLYLNNNQLTGVIPTALSNMQYIKWLHLNSNQLSGPLPSWLGNLTFLDSLDLSGNFFSGTIPSELSNLVDLVHLRVNNNDLSGAIPASLINLINLCEPGNPDYPCYAQYGLDLGYNHLNISGYSQFLLDFLAIKDPDWAQTQILPFSGCSNVLAIPASECDALVALYTSTSGSAWTDHTNWLENNQPGTWYGVYIEGGHVLYIDLLANGLNGIIPTEIGNLTELKYLYLFYNQLTSNIPSSIGNLVNLRYLLLFSNQLSGSIPIEFVNLVNLCTPDNLVYPCNGQYGLDLGYNRFNIVGYSQALIDFLALKDPDWAETQLAPFTSCDAVTSIPVSECDALVTFYNSTNGPNWTDHTNWLTNNQPGTWHGVSVTNGHVNELNLYNNNLTGSLPSQLVSLSFLTNLELGYNYNMSGTIPTWLGSMSNLQYLNLFYAGLSGTIPPEIGNLTNLTQLYLSWNALSGSIPSSIGNLTDLRFLDLSWNQLTGPIPPGLGNLSYLEHLALQNNQLTGSLPDQLASMTMLRDILLESNQFSGALPSWLGSITSLQQIFFGNNMFSGAIPPELGNLTGLLRLSLHHNQLSGQLPVSLINLVNLCLPDGNWPCWDQYGLDLGYNYLTTPATPQELADFLAIKDPDWATTQTMPFTGCGSVTEIPVNECEALVELYNSTNGPHWRDHTNWLENVQPSTWYGVTVETGNVTEISLGSNQLIGNIPSEIGNLTNLQGLYLYLNQLTGGLPLSLVNLNNLQYLSLFRNQLTGPIPTEMGSMSSLQALSLSSNQLSGTIPVELGNLTSLRTLSLGNNQLEGAIPIELCSLNNLESLGLYNNQLTGSIPSELGTLTNLAGLYLFGNQLTGGIPPELGNLLHLQGLDLSQNQLNGEIPTELGNLTEMVYLWLNNNILTGSIPAELGNMLLLTDLNLSHNQLSGLIPPELGNLTSLNGLWLDNNLLIGDVPASFTNLINLCTLDNLDEPCWGFYELDLGYNHLNVPAPEPPAGFLAIKDSDWYLTQAVEAEIPGETGGTVISNDGNTEIDIPAGAVEGLFTILFAPQPNPSKDIGVLNFAGNTFELTATIGETPVTTFAEPVILTLQYDAAGLGVIPEDSLVLYYWDTDQLAWLDAASTCDGGAYTRNLDENWLSLPICHLSEFALLGDSFDLFLPSIRR